MYFVGQHEMVGLTYEAQAHADHIHQWPIHIQLVGLVKIAILVEECAK